LDPHTTNAILTHSNILTQQIEAFTVDGQITSTTTCCKCQSNAKSPLRCHFFGGDHSNHIESELHEQSKKTR